MDAKQAMLEEASRQRDAAVVAGERLVSLSYEVEEVRTRMSALNADYKAAWSEAVKAGWTPTQLKGFGIKEPEAGARRRRTPRSSDPKRVQPSNPESNEEPYDQS